MSPAPADQGGRLGLVVVNYGSAHLVEQNLGRLDLSAVPVHVVLVDNFSGEAEREAARSLADAHGWQFLPLAGNRGFGGGVNAGVAAARDAGCAVFLMLNPDATTTPAVLDELRRECLRRPTALVSPRVLRPDGSVWFDGALLDLADGATRRGGPAALGDPPAGTQPWVTGACLAVHREMWDRLGGFDESYFLYWEDVDLSRRCLQAGGELVVREDLVAHHDVGGTQETGRGRAKSALYYRYNCRNRLVFAARHLSRAQQLSWVRRTPVATRDVLLRGGRRQLVRRPGLALAAARGSAEGLRSVVAALVRRPAAAAGDRVLVVHPGAELYGSDRMLAESVAGLVDRGCRVTVALPGTGPLVAVLEGLGAEVVTCPMPVVRKSALSPRGALALLGDVVRGTLPAVRLLRRRGTAGVYVSTQIIPLWAPLGRLLGRRVTTHVHEAEGAAPRVLRLLLALPVVLADRIVLNSRYSRDVLLGSLPGALARYAARRATVVYNGVAGPQGSPARRQVADGLRLLYVGRLSPRKGPHVALGALAELRDRGVRAELTLAGSVFPGYEWYEAELRATAAGLGLADAVRLPGFVPDVSGVLADADVVLIPSLQDEPFGNTAVEAVLAARPVVVSATSGLREAVDGLGSAQAVPPGEPAALADAVERVAGAWATYARDALADAAEAGRRYDVDRYRSDIAAIVLDRETP
ncbi:glycosyltransferase [Blastococcus sp. TF02A_35]|uniref:glycosyltransferase n=1 Tax=Blastococcus sp. TF02A-35 TaxID=2559612 RepID=UPI00143018A5|nr:glycosyltransferase [Blastococcus sp. TF02A_35]